MRVRRVVVSIAAGWVGLIAWDAGFASAAAAEVSSLTAATVAPTPRVESAAPPVLLASAATPVAPWTAPASPTVVAQSVMVQPIAPPDGASPGVWWLLLVGAALCRIGAHVVRGS